MNAALIIIVTLFGLAVGSFLNVVIYRVPLKMSLSRPGSACPGCNHPIAAWDNIPVLSWAVLRGRCRSCGEPIPARYPLVELLTAGLFVLLALRFGWSWTLPAEIVLVAGLVALSFIDYDHMLLPKRIVYTVGGLTLAALVVAAGVHGSWHRLGVAALCGTIEFAFLFSVNWINPSYLGFGDVRFGPVIALALGWIGWLYAFVGFFVANLVGAVIGMLLIAFGKGDRKTKIPFGVFLSIGAVLAIVFGGAIHYPV
jgi:leader peptidase (prepilin peptidase)/N-methyltransferase